MTLFKQISTRILATSPTIKRRDLVKLTDDIIDIMKRQTSQEVKEVSNTPIPTKPEYQHLVNIHNLLRMSFESATGKTPYRKSSGTPLISKPEEKHIAAIFDGVEINGVGKRGMLDNS
jgi:hypothetical protein